METQQRVSKTLRSWRVGVAVGVARGGWGDAIAADANSSGPGSASRACGQMVRCLRQDSSNKLRPCWEVIDLDP